MIKAIIFDWFGVCTVENWGDCVRRELTGRWGLPAEKITVAYKAHLQDFMSGRLSADGFFSKFIGALDPSLDPASFRYLLGIVPALNTELLSLIRDLRKGYRTYLLSNTVDGLYSAYEEKIAFADYFDRTFLSHILSLSKTDPRIWDAVLREIPFRPADLLFIDNKESYLSVAAKHGVQTLRFTSNSELASALAEKGISVR